MFEYKIIIKGFPKLGRGYKIVDPLKLRHIIKCVFLTRKDIINIGFNIKEQQYALLIFSVSEKIKKKIVFFWEPKNIWCNFEVFCINMAQGRLNRVSNENRTHL